MPIIKLQTSQITDWIRQHYVLRNPIVDIRELPGDIDLNYFLKDDKDQAFVCKIAALARNEDLLDLENELITYLQGRPLSFQTPNLVYNRTGQATTTITHKNGIVKLRLLTWVDGIPYADFHPQGSYSLESIGDICGQLSLYLQHFNHPAAIRDFNWNIAEVAWIKSVLPHLQPAERQLLEEGLAVVEQHLLPHFRSLRHSICYYDANDHNILLDITGKVCGVIDFGDAVYTATLAELAIGCAYALMGQPSPLYALVSIVKGYHTQFPLQEIEMKLLPHMITARLLISLTFSSQRKKEDPENAYWQISAEGGWALLKQWLEIPYQLIVHHIRFACGIEPHPNEARFRNVMESAKLQVAPLLDLTVSIEKARILDLSPGSLDLGVSDNFTNDKRLNRHFTRLLAGNRLAIGRYLEPRALYTTIDFKDETSDGTAWRTYHLGLDFFTAAKTPVYAPLAGQVKSIRFIEGERNYGTAIILQHEVDGLSFFTLYGHLSQQLPQGLKPGIKVTPGMMIGTIGDLTENGGWPPHLHFQVLLSDYFNDGDFPGVASHWALGLWQSVSPDPNLLLNLPIGPKNQSIITTQEIKHLRQNLLGPNLSLSYSSPLHIVRGYGSYLIDVHGKQYLDMVNNVAHVGHEHQGVVQSGQRQMAVLNTNSRYLHENIVKLAKALVDITPPELEVVYFTNSGSEANELALRMLKTITGGNQVIAIEGGYHGHTGACIDVSSYKFDGRGGTGRPPHIHLMPMPDTFRGKYRKDDGEDAGRKYADHIHEILRYIADGPSKLAGFIGESILSCGGQIPLPDQYLSKIYEEVRAAGGLCIADEVQTGLGRVGSHYWAFELHGVVPDILTIGKPFGNGHPLAALVTTRQVANSFHNGMEYFNTFAGNPVSCAIGLEVLQVLKDQELMQNARRIGKQLKNGLKSLQNDHPIIGDVRGEGLFLGFELVDKNLKPVPEVASYLVDWMQKHGILLSTDGPDNNVIKIKPPMVFDQNQAEFFLQTLEKNLDHTRIQMIHG